MKKSAIKTSLLIFLLSFIFYNGWIEDVLDQNRDFLTYEKTGEDQDIKKKINAVFSFIPSYFDQLKVQFNQLSQEKADFDNYFNEIIQLADLSQEKDVIADYKMKYLSLIKNFDDMKNILASAENKLESSFNEVNQIVAEYKNTFKEDPVKNKIADKELYQIQQQVNTHTEWIANTSQTIDDYIHDLNNKNKEFEAKTKETVLPEEESLKTDKMIEPQTSEMKDSKKEDIWQEIQKSKLTKDKKKSDKLYNNANQLFEKGDYQEALQQYKKAAQYNKDNFMALAGISKVYIINKQYDPAINMINRAINIFKKTK